MALTLGRLYEMLQRSWEMYGPAEFITVRVRDHENIDKFFERLKEAKYPFRADLPEMELMTDFGLIKFATAEWMPDGAAELSYEPQDKGRLDAVLEPEPKAND